MWLLKLCKTEAVFIAIKTAESGSRKFSSDGEKIICDHNKYQRQTPSCFLVFVQAGARRREAGVDFVKNEAN